MLYEQRDGDIHLLETHTGRLIKVIQKGQGPYEVNGGYLYANVMKDAIIVREFGQCIK